MLLAALTSLRYGLKGVSQEATQPGLSVFRGLPVICHAGSTKSEPEGDILVMIESQLTGLPPGVLLRKTDFELATVESGHQVVLLGKTRSSLI